jgi:NDP-sugar pyrophosphorylase family protein
MNQTIVILAGGLATRLKSLTQKTPKALLPVCGKPFIYHQLKLLKKNNVKKVLICAGFLGQMIADYVKTVDFGLEINFCFDGDKLLGTGGAIKKALPFLGESFMCIYGDSYLDIDYGAIEDTFIKSGKNSLMTVYKNNGLFDKSNVVFENGKIKLYTKKTQTKDMTYIDYGLGCFKTSIFKTYPKEIFDLAEIYEQQVNKNEIIPYEVFTRFHEIGSIEGLKELSSVIKRGRTSSEQG